VAYIGVSMYSYGVELKVELVICVFLQEIMIKIAKRVMHAIDLIELEEFELALEQAAICIDVSFQRFYKKIDSNRFDFKKF
jgi:hypothetical protein